MNRFELRWLTSLGLRPTGLCSEAEWDTQISPVLLKAFKAYNKVRTGLL